jgi:hypothetical protein
MLKASSWINNDIADLCTICGNFFTQCLDPCQEAQLVTSGSCCLAAMICPVIFGK